MINHVLSSADAWFIKKKRVDSLSRSLFTVGDTVVVCRNKHVMLADFYEGECHSCKDRQTVSFCYANVEYGYKLTENDEWFVLKNPTDKVSKKRISVGDTVVICDNKHMSLITSYNGKCPVCRSENTGVIPERKDLFAWLFPTKKTKRLLSRINPSLGWILGILSVVVLVLILTGTISNERLIEHWEESAFNETLNIFESAVAFIQPTDNLVDNFVEANLNMGSKSNYILNDMLVVLLALINGFAAIYVYARIPLQTVMDRTVNIYELFDEQTRRLIDIVTTRISNFFD